MTNFDALVRSADDLYTRFESQNKLSDLSLAVVHYRSALAVASKDSTVPSDARSRLLGNLANVLSIRFQRHQDLSDLTQSIECHIAALELRPPGHPSRASTLTNYATALLVRYAKLRSEADIELAINHLQAALDIIPPKDPARLMPLMNHASAFFSRFQCSGKISDLNIAIRQYHTLVDSCPHKHKIAAYYNLANALLSRFKVSSNPTDLDASIKYFVDALARLKSGHNDHPMVISGLATGLLKRCELRGDMTDLESAINYFHSALELHPPGHPNRFSALTDLADARIMRYNLYKDLPDLEFAVDLYRNALSLLPSKHGDEGVLLNNLGNALFLRFSRREKEMDLEEAIMQHRRALPLLAHDSERVILAHEALANCYDTRFERHHEPADLHFAIFHFSEALVRAPLNHPHISALLTNIVPCLEARFGIHGELGDLELAISHSRQSLDILPSGHRDRASRLHTLAGVLLLRFRELGDEFDLQQAYLHCSVALSKRMSNDVERASSQLLFSRIMRARFLPWHDARDLEPIFKHLRSAKASCTTNHDLLPDIYAELSTMHFLRYLLTQQSSELTEALGHHELSLHYTGGTSMPALRASQQWVKDAEMCNHRSGIDAYRITMNLLFKLALDMHSPERRQLLVVRHAKTCPMDAASFALRFQQPEDGIEMLEYGRELVWSQLVRTMTVLDDLRRTGKHGVTLADELERLNERLKQIPRIASLTSKTCKALVKEREAVIDQIRRKGGGFKRFLQLPDFSDLQKAATGGLVVVVNASQYSCDAVIVWPDCMPDHVPLCDLSLRDVSLMASRFEKLRKGGGATSVDTAHEEALARLLSELWDKVVNPIVQQIKSRVVRGSRLWWCPTGIFTSIPLHAAGPYHTRGPPLFHTYVSSYTSTLAVLARSKAPTGSPQIRRCISGFLKGRLTRANSMTGLSSSSAQSTPPSSSPFVIGIGSLESQGNSDQLDMLQSRTRSRVPLKRLEGLGQTTTTVAGAFKYCNWLHVACPVIHDHARPCRSTLERMQDGHIKLRDLARMCSRPDFAFVSTCRAVNEDESAVDELMALPIALQYTGFRSVVGTLWNVDEVVTRRVVSLFYEYAISQTAGSTHQLDAAGVLQRVLMKIEECVPLSQRIAFVHVGV